MPSKEDEAVPVHLCKTKMFALTASYYCLRTSTPVFSKPVQTICPALQSPQIHRALPSLGPFPASSLCFLISHSTGSLWRLAGAGDSAKEGRFLMWESPTTPQDPGAGAETSDLALP